jgi:lipid-binding SYLF domain-containing protein
MGFFLSTGSVILVCLTAKTGYRKMTQIAKKFGIAAALLLVLLPALPATASNGEAQETIKKFKNKDKGISSFFKSSYAYAVFPTVGKAGIGIGGAYGKGYVFHSGKQIGTAKLTQVSVGFQLGGQAYSEIIFFQNKSTFNKFTNGNLKFGAGVSAVAVTAGAAASASFNRGVAVFTMEKGGLMYEATVAGQSFQYSGKK